MVWLLGAAVNIGLIAGYIAALWAWFSAAERLLNRASLIRRRRPRPKEDERP